MWSLGCAAALAAGPPPDDEKHQDRHQDEQAGVAAEQATERYDGEDRDRHYRHAGGRPRYGAGRAVGRAGQGRLLTRQVGEQGRQVGGGASLQGPAGIRAAGRQR